VIKSALVTLAQTESIALTAPRGRQAWTLTPKGRTTLDTAELVLPKTFVRKLEQLIKNGVSVYIGYGIKEQPTENAFPPDEAAVKDLQRLADKYPNLTFMRLGNTHAKVLIKDSEFAAITSFNWLSFKGDPNRTFRDEQGTLLQVSDLVDQKFAELRSRFETPGIT
jgi:hypothetical protein